MKQALYRIFYIIADIHSAILQLNNRFEHSLTDKELHFLVIGLIGLAAYLVICPVFRALAAKRRIGLISWLYTFTLILAITFAIEIGQHLTGTGNLDSADILSGVAGFLLLHLLWTVISRLCRWLFRKK